MASSGVTSSFPACLVTSEGSQVCPELVMRWAGSWSPLEGEPLRFVVISCWDASYSGDGTSVVDELWIFSLCLHETCPGADEQTFGPSKVVP